MAQYDLFEEDGRPEPVIRMEAYQGGLTHLLALAQARRIDILALDLVALVDQLTVAIRASSSLPLGRKAEWAVMVSGLLLLRSRLMLPADDPRQREATDEVSRLRAQLLAAEEAGRLAAWLSARPQLGQEIHVYGGGPACDLLEQPPEWETDRIEFLWGCLAVFDGNWGVPPPEPAYAPVQLDLFDVEDARVRVRHALMLADGPVTLDRMLPDRMPPDRMPSSGGASEAPAGPPVRARSAWTSTFTACLELVKQGEARATQADPDPLPAFCRT
ncbi:hypothetical protein [Novacetimonas hansenii]|uniref:hypothetical protein n=1 Tax=Novacetimonas hansenii TaxID=436 RepID=UPI00094F7E23|nr:hypothetical protein [Novacetimonas hansenii]PYD73897.1 hypothetical protein CFR74_02960 [Novacetimonas hansenii]